MWQFWASWSLFDELAAAPEDERRVVKAALDALLEDPYDPPGLDHHRFWGLYGAELYVAHLPHGWYVTYRPCPNGLPPMAGKFVLLRELTRDPTVPRA